MNIPETAYLIDFDGTITTLDITTELALYYGGEEFIRIDERYRAKEIPIRIWLQAVAALLPADLELLNNKALEWAQIRPGFEQLLEKARKNNNPVTVASDGLGFYIEPILKQHGLLEKIQNIYRNDTILDRQGRLKIVNPHAHPTCTVCGNCKAALVVRYKQKGHPVIYIGDGSNDRYGASWSDKIYALEELAGSCRYHGLGYSSWIDFYDIIDPEHPVVTDRSAEALCCPLGSGVRTKQGGEG